MAAAKRKHDSTHHSTSPTSDHFSIGAHPLLTAGASAAAASAISLDGELDDDHRDLELEDSRSERSFDDLRDDDGDDEVDVDDVEDERFVDDGDDDDFPMAKRRKMEEQNLRSR